MNQQSELPQELRDKLVAYLDGELSDEDAQAVEKTLADNPVARRELEQLANAWEMLDILPRAKTTEEFTERTLSTIRAVKDEERLSQSFFTRHARRITTVTSWAVGLVVVAILGFCATNQWLTTDGDRLVEELTVIRNLDMYTEVGSIEFLRELQASGVFDEAVREEP